MYISIKGYILYTYLDVVTTTTVEGSDVIRTRSPPTLFKIKKLSIEQTPPSKEGGFLVE